MCVGIFFFFFSNWPTPENVEAKKQKLAEDKEDGIVVDTKEFV